MTENPGLGSDPKDVGQESSCSIACPFTTSAYDLSQLEQCSLIEKNNCAVNETTDSAGHRYKFNNRSKKRNRDGYIMEKLNEIKTNYSKDPVTKLNEITLLMKKTIINYELISISGAAHSPVFTVCAKNDDITVYGSGPSKKDAKKNAAFEFLNKMESYNGQNDITSTTSNEDFAEKQPETNPIGALQELCMTNHWQNPHYEFIREVLNESNSDEFSVICSLNIFKSTGKGNNKQSAKKQAARLLYYKIKRLAPEDKALLNQNNIYKTLDTFLLDDNHYENNNLIQQEMVSHKILKCLKMFIYQLNYSKNHAITYLKGLKNTGELKNCAVNVMYAIGKEEGFPLTYVKHKINHEVLVQVSILPILVSASTGKTFAEARENAAYGALIYLKLLLEK